MADRSSSEATACRERDLPPAPANPAGAPSMLGGMDLPIALLARQWRDPPDDFEDLVARTKSSLDRFMEHLDEIGNDADLRAHRLIAGSLIDLSNTVISTGRKPTRIGSGIAKALEALLLADPREECIGAVNELRGMLSTPMLSESSFFTLAPGAERLTQGFPDHDIHDRIKSVVGEGQREFQRGLWEWVSGNPDGLRRIASVLVAIDDAAQGRHALWRIAARFSTLMAEENAAPGHALMRLVGQIDHQIRRFCAPGYKVERPPEALMHNLLFHIERCGIDSETARLAKEEFALGGVFEIPAAGGGWPAAALSKTMELLLRVSTSLEDASPFRGEIAAIRRDLIRARDAMLLADRPDIARRMDRAVDCLSDPQRADPNAAAEIVKGAYKALEEGSTGAEDAKSAPQDAAGRPAPDLSRIPDFSRAKELMDRIDAAVVVGEPGLDEGEASESDDERDGSDPEIGDARKAASELVTKASLSAFDEKTPESDDSPAQAAVLPSIAAKAPLPSAAGESFRSSDIESISGTDDGEEEPPRKGEKAIEESPPHPSEAGRTQGVAEPLEARQGVEDKEAAFAGDDLAVRNKPSSRFDPKDSALDTLLDRVRTLGATHREIAKGVRKIGQGFAQLERLAGIDAPSLDQGIQRTEEAFDRPGSPKAAEDAGDPDKARRLIPVLRAIAAHTEGLLERGQREGESLEKSVIGLRLVPLHIGIRRIRVIATRPRADGKRLAIDVRGEEQRCDPAVMDHLFPIIENLIERVIDQVLETPSPDVDRAGDPPAKLGLDFSIGRGSLSLRVIAKGRALGETSLAKIRDRIDKARGRLEILPSLPDRFDGLRVELPLTRWRDRVVVVRTKKARFALFAREVVAILRPPGSGRLGRQGIYRQAMDRVLESGATENLGAADSLDAKKADSRHLEGEEIAIADDSEGESLESGSLESEGFEYEGDIYPLRAAFAGREGDARREKDDDAAAISSPSVALLRIGEKRAALLCEEIEIVGECTLCALPPLVAGFAKSAVVFADGRAPAALIESETIIEDDSEDGASAEAPEPS